MNGNLRPGPLVCEVRGKEEVRGLLALLSLLLLGAAMACGGSGEGPSPTPASHDLAPQPGDQELRRGPAFVDDAELVELQSHPPQYLLRLRGSLPTPCHRPRAAVSRDDAQGQIRVEVYSLSQPGAICAQVLAPFEGSLSLGTVSRRYQVLVNGQPVGSIGP